MSTHAPQVPLVSGGPYRLRHIYPQAGGAVTVLGRAYGAEPLPGIHHPMAVDLSHGSITRRLGDSGEMDLSFPNAPASDGRPWLDRFAPDGHLEWIEVYGHDTLEQVACITRVASDRGEVTVSGQDGFWLLRKAYESDRTWTDAPRDVIAHYTQVPVALSADGFNDWSLPSIYGWVETTGVASLVSPGRMRLEGTTGARVVHTFASPVTGDWRVTLRIEAFSIEGPPANPGYGWQVELRSTAKIQAALHVLRWASTSPTDIAQLWTEDGGVQLMTQIPFPEGPFAAPVTVQIERQGRWVTASVNGARVGFLPDIDDPPATLEIATTGSTSTAITVEVDDVIAYQLQPFLSRGADIGDLMLPGDQPQGGLRGRYWNDSDLEGATAANRRARIMAPDRTHYAERLDAAMVNLRPPPPRDADTFWSARWFGSVYLDFTGGGYQFAVTHAAGTRVWVLTTAWGAPTVDDWTLGASRTSTGTVLGVGAGWFPIVMEYHEDTAAAPGPALKFTPLGTGTYVDPGGQEITRGSITVIPSTSLSPVGCFDQRVQGQSHFDLVQSVSSDYGYQLVLEPKQLESGEFPGRLVPRIRCGRDTDEILRVEDVEQASRIISPSRVLDSADEAVLVRGSGAGLPDAKGSQIIAEVSDTSRLTSGLFATTAISDAADIAYPDLLHARLEAELALRASPWEEVSGQPVAHDRIADTWPLSGVLSAFRWEPGDGVRIWVPEVGIRDATPRQITQVTREFTSDGRTGTSVGFRQRPRSAAHALRNVIRSVVVPRRAYQGQHITLTSQTIVGTLAAAAWSGYAGLPLLPSDRIVTVELRIVRNGAAQVLGVEINGTDRTVALGGGWSHVPTVVGITAYSDHVSATDPRLYVRLQNTGGSSTDVEFVMIATVRR